MEWSEAMLLYAFAFLYKVRDETKTYRERREREKKKEKTINSEGKFPCHSIQGLSFNANL